MKEKKILLISLIICVALIITLLPFASACDTGTSTATPKKSIKIGIMTPTTGPAAEKGAPMGDANLDAIAYVNAELGGIEKQPIDVSWVDSGYDAAKVVTIVKRFMDEGCVMFSTSSSKEMQAAMEIANRAEFPGLAAFGSPSLYRPPKHIYGQLPDYGDDALAFAQYYMKNIWKGTGKPKFALHLLNNPTGYGARDAYKAKAGELGIEIVSTDEHAATTTSEMESLTRIKAKKPDVLYISSTPAPTAVIIKNAVELGMYPGMTIASGHAGFTKVLVDLGGADRVEGVYGVYPTVGWDDKVPGMAKVVEYCNKLRAGTKDTGNMDYITSWAQSLIMVEAVKLAVKNAGYDVVAKGDVNSWRAVETKGIQKLKNYEVGGIHGAVTYTPGDNRLAKSVRVFQIKKGVITPIGSWVDAPVVEYEKYDWFGK
jgi:branched-chain amino acid transport system substrate-binding protein